MNLTQKKISMKNVFFLKSFAKNLALLLLPLCIISGYSLYRIDKDTTETIEARNWNLLYQVKTQADTMFQTVDEAASFLTSSSSIQNILEDAFLSENVSSHTIKQTKQLASFFQSIINSNTFADSAYLYFDNDFGRYLATANGLSRAFNQNQTQNEWLDSYYNSSTDFWCEAKKINTFSLTPDKEVLVVYQKLYSAYSYLLPRGVCAAYYSLEDVRAFLNNIDLYPGQVIFFFREDGTLLFQNSEKDYDGLWEQISYGTNNLMNYQSFMVEYGGEKYTAASIPSTAEGIYYVTLVPNKNLYVQTKDLTLLFSLIVLGACVLSTGLALISARHEYNQLKSIIDLFDHADKELLEYETIEVTKKDPYQLILHNVIELFLKQNYLKLQIDNKQYKMELLELRALQHQINPHFLFNTLNSIYWESVRTTGTPNTCSAMITDLSEIMGYSLSDSLEETTVERELTYLQHYINIQKFRYKDKLTVLWDIDEECFPLTIPKMILQPLVENSIYHGIKEKEGAGTIKIKVFRREDRMVVHVVDNGQGISPERLTSLKKQLQDAEESPEHIGLLNTNKRLILSYGGAAAIRLYSNYERGTAISFSIPADEI